MPPAYTPPQRGAIAQFVSFTSVKESVAAKEVSYYYYHYQHFLGYITKGSGTWLQSFLDPILLVPVHTGFGAMELARRDLWNVFEDRDGDSREQKLYKARARLERKLVLMPTGIGRCALDDDQEAKSMMLANSREYPEHIFKRSLDDLLDEELPLEDEAQVERFRRDQFRGESLGLYHSWLENAENPCHWMMKHDIPKYLRFALHRPLMSEDELYGFLQSLGVRKHFHDCLDGNTPQNRVYRCLLRASLTRETTHPSTLYAPFLPRGQGDPEQSHTSPLHTSKPGRSDGGHGKLQPTADEDVSESDWEFIQGTLAKTRANICNTIKKLRCGGYVLGDVEVMICDHLKSSKFCIKKYAARIEDPSFDQEKLASEIYTDALFDDSGDCPGSVGDWDQGGECFDTTEEELEDMSNAITLYRRGVYTLKQAKKVIRESLFPLEYRMADYVLMIKDHRLDATALASYIYNDALNETGTPQGLDDNEDSQEGLHAEESVSLFASADRGTPGTAAEPLKLKFSSSSRLAAIFQDVLQGHLAVEEAPSLFRSALSKPNMSVPDLSHILHQNEIPSDMFFSREQITPMLLKTRLNASEANRAEFDENPMDNKFTPAHSRESSIWFNTAAKSYVKYPETPPLNPEDGMPSLERVPVLDQIITGNLTVNRLPSATPKLAAAPVAVDCLYEDDEDAEIPEPGYEYALEDSANNYGGEMQVPAPACEGLAEDWASNVGAKGEIKETTEDTAANLLPGEPAMVSIETDDRKTIKSLDELAPRSGGGMGISNASKQSREEKTAEAIPSLSVDAIANCSSLPQPSAAPATTNATVAQPSPSRNVDAKSNGSSMGPPIVPEKRTPMHRYCKDTRRGSFCATSPQPVKSLGDARQRSEGSRSARSQVGYQQFAEAYVDLGSSSPEDGETDDLHGIRMPTRDAQKLAFGYGLPRGFVETYVRSDTAERAANKKHLAARDVQFVPMLKRRRTVSSSGDLRSKSTKFEEVNIPFADDHEDHLSFMEHRMRSQGPVPDIAPELRCARCDCFPCLCRGRGRSPSPREFCQPKSRFRISSLELSSSHMGASAVRNKRKSKSAEALQQRGRQPTPRVDEDAAQRMSVAWLLSAPGGPGENTNRLVPPFERSPSSMEGDFSKSTSEAALISQHTIHPPTSVHLPNPDRSLPPTPFIATSIADTPMQTGSTREVCRPFVLPQTPVNLPTSLTPSISMPTIEAGETLMRRIVAELAPIARESLSQRRASRNNQGDIQSVESGLPSDITEIRAKTHHQEITKAAPILQDIAKQALSLLASPQSSGSEVLSYKSSSASVPIPTRCETDREPKSIIKNAETAMSQEHGPKSANTPSRQPSLSSDLQTLSLCCSEGPVVPIPCGIDNETQENEGIELAPPRTLSISTNFKSLQPDNEPEDGCCRSGRNSGPTQCPRPRRVPFSGDSPTTKHIESSSLSTPIARNTFSGRNATIDVKEIDLMDDDKAGDGNDCSSVDSVPFTPTKGQPVAVKVRKLDWENQIAKKHTKSAISFQPGPAVASPRQLADDAMNQSASTTPSSQQPPPAPRPKHAVANMSSASSLIPATAPRPGHKELNMGDTSMMKPLSSLQPPRTPQPTDLPHIDVLPSYAELAANPPSRNQHVVDSPLEMPEDYVERVLARMENFNQRAERSGRRHRPRPQLPRPPKRPKDDLYEQAWNKKVSAFVYLWQRRRNRQLADRDHSPDRYFSGVSAPGGRSSTSTALNKVFDKYREDATNSPDIIGTSGTMQYLTELSVALDEPAVLAILTELAAPTMGELGRDGFVQGWGALKCETLQKQQSSVGLIRKRLFEDIDFFRKVYKHTFLLARQPGQKGVQLETAIDFWRLLFSQGGFRWKDAETDWLELYVEFLESKWRKSINKDLWDQTGVFAQKTLEDGSMSWWSEDGAWPGVIDDFVAFVRERRGVGERMEM